MSDEHEHELDDELAELVERIRNGIMKDYVETGEALRRARDERLYKASYPSFEAFVRDQFNMHRSTAHHRIRAAEVAGDLAADPDPRVRAIELPQEHAALLYRLAAEDRRNLAFMVTGRTFREAAKIVLAYVEEHDDTPRPRQKKHKPLTTRVQQLLLDLATHSVQHIVDELDELQERDEIVNHLEYVVLEARRRG